MTLRSTRDAVVLVAAAITMMFALVALDGGLLAAPRSWSIGGWSDLVVERGPAVAALTVLRYAGLAMAAYLLVLGLLLTIAQLLQVRRLDALLWLATPRFLRPMLGIVTMVTFAAPSAAGAAEPNDLTATSAKAPVMVLVQPSATSTTIASSSTASSSTAPSSPAPTMRRVTPTTTPTMSITSTTVRAATPTTTLAVEISRAPTTPAPAARAAPATEQTWAIERGQHLWSVAETVLTERLGHAPTDAEVTGYWQRLISANHDRLADPTNPDLVFTGQVFVLPVI